MHTTIIKKPMSLLYEKEITNTVPIEPDRRGFEDTKRYNQQKLEVSKDDINKIFVVKLRNGRFIAGILLRIDGLLLTFQELYESGLRPIVQLHPNQIESYDVIEEEKLGKTLIKSVSRTMYEKKYFKEKIKTDPLKYGKNIDNARKTKRVRK